MCLHGYTFIEVIVPKTVFSYLHPKYFIALDIVSELAQQFGRPRPININVSTKNVAFLFS